MAHPDDPSYLTVGTEVSAKYRGAFCEATIKIAERLVKCKVSYGKGQSAVVTNDCVKGPLKVGAQVEVRQPDGTTLAASLAKVTDHSTYTVVFDDGDERTLKRSSLCLKGGRHFHESESLDHLPLTDPENFGTPVNTSSKKPGRRRRHASQSPPWENTSKKNFRSPSEFTVGKAVFLENDRRRLSWLPAVVVPTHYVLEPSEMTPDAICLRSFKDGRYHVATENELHEFSPDKEPLLSMLEGDIQPMYMDKPAIERAMAYLDTGELPWDMDIFNQHPPSESRVSEASTSDDEDQRKNDEDSAEAKEFYSRLKKFHEARGTPIQRQQSMGPQNVSLFQLYQRVAIVGGMDRVTQEMKWRSVHLQLGMPSLPTTQSLRQIYKKFLYQFELFEKNKAKLAAKEGGGKCTSTADKNNKTPGHNTVEERLHPQTPALSGGKGTGKSTDSGSRVNGMERGKRGPPNSIDTPVPAKRAKSSNPRLGKVKDGVGKRLAVAANGELPKSGKVKEPEVKMEVEEEEEYKNSSSDTKSEVSDSDPPSVGNTSTDNDWASELMATAAVDRSSSSSNLDRGEQRAGVGVSTGLEKCEDGYIENDRVLVLYGKGKTQRLYEAKVISVEVTDGKKDYLVHYSGWNNRYNEWIDNNRIMGKIVGPYKSRPYFNKRKKSSKNGSKIDLFHLSLLPPGVPTPASGHSLKSSPHSSRTTPPPVPGSSTTPTHLSSSVDPMMDSKETITDKSLGLANGKKPSKRNGALTNMRPSTSPNTSYGSSPLASSNSPSTEAGSASVRHPGRPRGGKLDRSRAKGAMSGRSPVVVKEERDSVVALDSMLQAQPSSSSGSSSGSSSSNDSSNDEEQPVLVSVTAKKETSSHSSPSRSLDEKPLPPNSSTAKSLSTSTSSSCASPQVSNLKAPSGKLPSSSSPAASKSPLSTLAKSLAKSQAHSSKPRSPPVAKTSSTPPAKPPAVESNRMAVKPSTSASRQQSEQQTMSSKDGPPLVAASTAAATAQLGELGKSLMPPHQSPVKPVIALTKVYSTATKPSLKSTPQLQSPEKSPVPSEAKYVLDPRTQASFSPPSSQLLTTSPPRHLPPAPPPPHQVPTPPKASITSLICSETLPGLVPRRSQPLRAPPEGSVLNEPAAQCLLSLAMSSPVSSHKLSDAHVSQISPPNHRPSLLSQSTHTPKRSVQDFHLRGKEESVEEEMDTESKDEEEEEEDEEDDRHEDEELLSDNEDEDEGTEEEENKMSSIQKSRMALDSCRDKRHSPSSRSHAEVNSQSLGRGHSLPHNLDKDATPLPQVKTASPIFKQLSCGSSSPDRKRRLSEFETPEEYEKRKKARHAELNFLNFANLPDMSSVERISLIQDRLQEVQKRWTDLKTEVAYIERKRKRAKRKAKGGSSSQAMETSPPSHHQPPLQQAATISCH